MRPAWTRIGRGQMHYTNSQMKLDQLIGYFNARKINLIPPFQRGHVWKLSARQRLLENMVSGRPIPAIFLYKEPVGSTFEYNILDGKQRLESLILFIGNNRKDMSVTSVKDYFFNKRERNQIHFEIDVDGRKTEFKSLSDEVVREFREYAIPTIEIDLDDETSLDEIINLFVDINQQGEKVKRFDIVKAIGRKNKLLSSVFELVAQQTTRKQDKYFKPKNTAYSRVLEKLQAIETVSDPSQKVDRMWERLFEIALMSRTGKHRQPNQILKTFIKADEGDDTEALSAGEKAKLQRVFAFLDTSYDQTALGQSRLARDLPHFYTMVTTLLTSDLLDADNAPPDYPGVRKKLVSFSKMIKAGAKPPKDQAMDEALKEYIGAASRQTTHPGRRQTREQKFLEILGKI